MAHQLETRPGRSRAPAALRAWLGFLALLAVSCAALSALRARDFEQHLGSDEPEWIAISILHWNQLVRGHPPGGAELKPGAPAESPWKQGVQNTTFGYMNPCLPKLGWGGLLALAGHTRASPLVFQTFHRDAPERGREAQLELLEAMPLARGVVLALASLSGALLFCVARASVPCAGGPAGWLAGGTALALWLASPLVLRTASYIRTDHFMLPFALGLWWWTLARRAALAGAHGLGPALRAGAMAGLLGGLAVSSKLNGALALVACGAAVLAHWLTRPDPRPPVARPLAAVALTAAAACGTFLALNPLLWSGPLAGVEDILARWDKLMGYFQDEWAPSTGVAVARTRTESLALFFGRTLARDGPLAAWAGLPLDLAWMALGTGLLALAAAGRGPLSAGSGRGAATCSLCFVAVLVLGTALWLPLDWERLYLPAVPAFALLGAALAAALAARLGPGSARVPDPGEHP